MNFLGHLYLAGDASPEFKLGSMAPDFVGMVGQRLHRISPANRDCLDASHRDVQKGVDYHLACDAAMNGLAKVSQLKQTFRQNVQAEYPAIDDNTARVVNEIGTDLMLDGYIVNRYPNLVDDFGQTIGSCEKRLLAYPVKGYSMKIIKLIQRFESSLPNYDDMEVVSGLIWRRTKGRKSNFDIKLIPTITKALNAHKALVYSNAPGIFQHVEQDANKDKLFTNRGNYIKI